MVGLSSDAIGGWARRHLASGSSSVLSDGLACFRAVTTANRHHTAVVTGGKHPNDLPQFRGINTLLGNLKTSFSGTFHAFNVDQYARRYPGGYCFRFNRPFPMVERTERIANALSWCIPCTGRDPRVAEAYGSSSFLRKPEVEGAFDSGSRKFPLKLIMIMARLTQGAKTPISMAFLVMCAEKMLRILHLLLS